MIFVGNITSLKNITPEMAEKTVKMCFSYLPKQKFFSADTETETESCFTVSAKPKFGQNGRNLAENRNRICFGRTLQIASAILAI